MPARRCFLALAFALSALAQTAPEARYRQLFENDRVRVYTLELAPGQNAPIYQNVHDVVLVALQDAAITLVHPEGDTAERRFTTGDTRFLPRFRGRLLRNNGSAPFRAVLVEILSRGLNHAACGCGTRIEKSVCGCENGSSLPDLWALSLGDLTMAGSSLDPGHGFRAARPRDDMLLVAVTSFQLRDDAGRENPRPIALAAGEVSWFKPGRHQFRNVGTTPARFVTLEF